MLTPTIAFSLISCNDIKTAALIANVIPRAKLHNRILLLKTSKGNFAKLHVQSGTDLHISDLVVYNPAGCIIKTATNLVIHASFHCDVDNAVQTSNDANADFWWHAISASDSALEPKNGAAFVRLADVDDVTFNNLSTATYSDHRIPREWLKRQLIYCKTSQGRFAKLSLEWNATELIVRSFTTFNADGTQHLSKANIVLHISETLDLDNGVIASNGRDIWWEAETADISTHYLTLRNGAKFSFDSFYQYEKYLPLLKNVPIRGALVISGAPDRPYSNWTEAEKLQLREFVYLLETNKTLPLVLPALASDTFMSNCDALKIYMAHVAQSFWVDANNKVSWDIIGASADHLAHLFDMRKLYKFTAGSGYSFDFGMMGGVTDWSPAITYQFMIDNSMIKANKWDTIKAVAEWVRANLFHISGFATDMIDGPFATQQDQWQFLFGYRGLPPVDKMITPLPGKNHVTHGCWGTDGFFAAVLRSVNIPVKHGRSNFSGDNHSRAEFFTEGKNLMHGDDPYNGWVRLGINNVPIHRVFVTNAELTSLVDAPPALPGKTVPETASHNHVKFLVDLGIEFKTKYLLSLRCQDKNSGINNGPGSQVWSNLHDFYTNPQIDTIVAACDTAITTAGGCAAVNAS